MKWGCDKQLVLLFITAFFCSLQAQQWKPIYVHPLPRPEIASRETNVWLDQRTYDGPLTTNSEFAQNGRTVSSWIATPAGAEGLLWNKDNTNETWRLYPLTLVLITNNLNNAELWL